MRFIRSSLVLFAIAGTGLQFGQKITFKQEVNLVEVYTTVFDRHGQAVEGLNRDQFEISDDGKAQAIRVFEPTHGALSCALLLDTTGSMAAALTATKKAARNLIESLRPDDSVGVYAFTDHLDELQEMSTDHAASKMALIQLRAGGRTALFDSISQLARDLEKKQGKKVIVVLTDGGENASVLNREAAVASARKAGVPIFAVAEGEALHDDKASAVLSDLTEATGGALYAANHPKEIGAAFQAIARYVQSGYLLAFQASPQEQKTNCWHKLQVRVKGTERPLRVRARTGYWLE